MDSKKGMIGYWNTLYQGFDCLNQVAYRFAPSLTASKEAMALGVLKSPWSENKRVYVLPFQAKRPSYPREVLIPLWIPAILTPEGLLLRCSELFSLPYIPVTFLSKTSAHGIVLGELNRYECLLSEAHALSEAWSSYYQESSLYLDVVSENTWQKRLTDLGYEIQTTPWIVEQSRITESTEVLNFENPLIQRLLTLNEENMEEIPQAVEKNFCELLNTLLSLPEQEPALVHLTGPQEKSRLLSVFLERFQGQQRICVLSQDTHAWAKRSISEDIQLLQQKDENLETVGQSLHTLLSFWQEERRKAQTGWRQWVSWMLPSSKKAFEAFFVEFKKQPLQIQQRFEFKEASFEELETQLVEAFRENRVERACLHRELTALCDLQSVVQVVDPTQSAFHATGQNWDLCIIDEAQSLAPWQVLSWLAHSKRIWVLAHPTWPKRSSLVPANLDFECAAFHGCVLDETDFENIEWAGMSASGDVWRWFCSLSGQSPLIWVQEQTQKQAAVVLLPCEAKAQLASGQYVNFLEAEKMLDWVCSQSQNSIAIVVPFAAQKKAVQTLLEAKNLTTPVYLLGDLNMKPYEIVVFGATYDAQSPRPLTFDCGEEALNWLQAMVTEQLVLVGSSSVWDQKLHSPSGRLAKKVPCPQLV